MSPAVKEKKLKAKREEEKKRRERKKLLTSWRPASSRSLDGEVAGFGGKVDGWKRRRGMDEYRDAVT